MILIDKELHYYSYKLSVFFFFFYWICEHWIRYVHRHVPVINHINLVECF